MSRALVVEDPGLLSLVEDEGRPGLACYGVGPSGAVDRSSYRRANELVGNAAGAAAIETLGGLRLRARGELWVAVAGAPTEVRVDGAAATYDARIRLHDGEVLSVAHPSVGLRCYVAVRGGIDLEPVLGSRSRDVLASLGPERLAAGALLAVGPLEDAPWAPRVLRRSTLRAGEVELGVVLGPRADRVPGADALLESTWEATTESSRVALRLRRPEGVGARGLAWDASVEHPSEGLVRGSVQVPPSGLPVLFLADHPVTGGYPVVAVVVHDATDLAGQVRPGQRVRFVQRAAGWSTSA